MTQILRQNTAVSVPWGPFVDSTDGDTPETALTIQKADVRLKKAGGNMAAASADQGAADAGAPHDEIGVYDGDLDATDTNTIGILDVYIRVTGALTVKHSFQIIDEDAYDAIYGSPSTILTGADIGQLFESSIASGSTQTSIVCADNIVSDDNWIGNTVTIEDISTGEIVTRYITDVVQSTNTITINAAPPFTSVIGDKVRVESRQHPTYAITNYDPPTSSEATSDRTLIMDRIKAYTQLLARKDAAIATDLSTELGEINNDEGTGAGNYNNATDSVEALRDNQSNIGGGGATTVLNTTIASLGSQTSITLTDGSPDNDVYNNMFCILTDQTTTTQISVRKVSDYVGSSKVLTINSAPDFTIATGDQVEIIAVPAQLEDILADTNELQSDDVPGLISALNDITASEVWAETLGTTSLSASALVQIIAGVLAGELSGAATSSITIRNVQDSGDLIVATVDVDGNRSAISITTPAT